VDVDVQPDQVIKVSGDSNHPSNFGRLCSKGAALGETVGLAGRLLHPTIQGQEVSWDDAIKRVANGFSDTIARYGPDSVAFYVSGQLLTEDYYVVNKLIKGYIGSANIDTNSRLCMASSVIGHKRAFGADAVPCAYEDLEQANLIVLTGSNTAWCHPVLFQRIAKARKRNPDLRVVVIDPRRTSTCDIADLHLPLQPGSDTTLFNGLLAFLHENDYVNALYLQQYSEGYDEALAAARQSAPTTESVASLCGLSVEETDAFFRLFANTERAVTVYSQGVNQSTSGSDKVNAIINCHLATGRIGRPGMGPFSFTGQPNAMGGREVGGLANQLAAHMDLDNERHRDIVQRFWQSPHVASQAGYKAVDLFRAVKLGKVKAIWIMGTNPVVSVPDADLVREALRQCPLVVVSDCMADTDTTRCADILLPAAAWGEKDGTVTNSERRISRQRSFLPLPGAVRPDWWIVCQVAREMGYEAAFNFENPAEIFREHARLSGFENGGSRDFDISGLARVADVEYDRFTPVQWPVAQDRPYGTQRLFADGRFYTATGKARFVPIQPRPPANATSSDFPLVLNTGRVRDQWHTMTRTGKSPRLAEHSPEPYAEMHPRDMATCKIADGALCRVHSRWGEVIVRAKASDGQLRGSVFVPMHWNSQYASQGRVDSLVNPALDPLSGQPEFKHTPVRVAPYQPAWHGFLLSRRQVDLKDATYWVKATGKQFVRYELAGEQAPEDWAGWSRSMLCTSDADINWVEYLDKTKRHYRGVRLVGNRVESCIFIAPGHALPPRNWLAGLFDKDTLDEDERKSLLAGKPLAGQKDCGAIVCACFSVGINTLREAIESEKLTTVEEIGAALKAGTNCGSCIPELKTLLQG
jgi:assimilatory nitrate reductase catalytic subunit